MDVKLGKEIWPHMQNTFTASNMYMYMHICIDPDALSGMQMFTNCLLTKTQKPGAIGQCNISCCSRHHNYLSGEP